MSATTETTEPPKRIGVDPQLFLRLAAPFLPSEIKFRPGAVAGGRALALHYVDARVIQDRLDDVMGVGGWQDDYEFLPDGSAICRLRLLVGGEWMTKTDVGGQSEQPDEGDRHKAAVSDALKRAAVKFGIGRYLYRMPQQWCDYDPQKKRFVSPPRLPDGAMPPQTPAPAKALPARAIGQVVSAPQHDELIRVMQESGLDPHKFCDKYKIDSPENLPASKFEEAIRAIRDFQARKTVARKPATNGATK